jgi:lipopolysaccharide/colanic/teichoic acid biosynthesis glycosyltransferase
MAKLVGPEWVTSSRKRSFDVAFATPAAAVTLPIALLAAGAIASTTLESPLFRQQRPGRNGDPFTILKLRTMPKGTPHTRSNRHYDKRATNIGRVLRVTRIDEIPQLVNVLKGDMSVVGPRPLVPSHIEEILDKIPPYMHKPWQDARRLCRPGMVDPYLVDVYVHDATDNPEAWAESDIEYAAKSTFMGDVRTLAAASGLYKHILEQKLDGQ